MKIRIPKFLRKFIDFGEEKPKAIPVRSPRGLPPIDERKALVQLPEDKEEPLLYYNEKQTASQEDTIQKSCAMCKFAEHNENLEDLKSILCTVNPNKPAVKISGDTCLQHVSKYPNLKVFVDNDNLMEYDSTYNRQAGDYEKQRGFVSSETTIVRPIGEDQWQL